MPFLFDLWFFMSCLGDRDMVDLVKHLPRTKNTKQSLGSVMMRLGMVVHALNSSTWETKGGGSLQLEASLVYIRRHFSQNKSKYNVTVLLCVFVKPCYD